MSSIFMLLIFLRLTMLNTLFVENNRPIRIKRGTLVLGNLCETYDKQLGTCTLKTKCQDNIYHKKTLTRSEFLYIFRNKCGRLAVCCLTNYSLLPNSTNCGKSSNDMSPRIHGGRKVKPEDFSWMALLEYERKFDKSIIYLCGGSLISDRYILTAAHCFYYLDNVQFRYEVRLGEWNSESTQPVDTNNTLNFGVESLIPHYEYSPFNAQPINDIALLRLNTTIKFIDYITPICLPIDENYIEQNYNNKELTVVGWGATETISFSNEKLCTNVKCVKNSECNAIYPLKFKKLDDEKQLCAGGDGENDSCNGDSGGPLMYYEQNRWKIIGIVSYGPNSCASLGKPAVYTRIDGFIPWIIEHIH